MSNPPTIMVPSIPPDAPFTPSQRAWLNGFLAGLYSRAPGAGPAPQAESAPDRGQVSIFFGSQSGNAEKLAYKAGKALRAKGYAATVAGMEKARCAQLAGAGRVLLITSTFGDGEPPDNARDFHAELMAWEGRLDGLAYSVLALGDSNYPAFCKCGADLDARLEALGARRLHARADCDVDFDAPASAWLEGVAAALEAGPAAAGGGAPAPITLKNGVQDPAPAAKAAGKAKTAPARLVGNRDLHGPGAEKETRHIAFDLGGTGLAYEAGDALGVVPRNCPELVEEILAAAGFDGESPVPSAEGGETSLRQALADQRAISRLGRAAFAAFAERAGDPDLRALLEPAAGEQLRSYLHGRELIDLLLAHPGAIASPADLIAILPKLAPRLYSIASSPKAGPARVELTVGVVRYQAHGRGRKGVCSTFLAERAGAEARVFVQANPRFRAPADGDRDLVMVGPGTGIAPFRGFLQERKLSGARGRNWLFFGNPRSGCDFLYREEVEGLRDEGTLHRLDLAFSRDQEHKIYVQDRMRERGAELWRWLQAGAAFCVCGDAARMAKDVDAALRAVVREHGGRDGDGADAYVEGMKSEGRYLRDVY